MDRTKPSWGFTGQRKRRTKERPRRRNRTLPKVKKSFRQVILRTCLLLLTGRLLIHVGFDEDGVVLRRRVVLMNHWKESFYFAFAMFLIYNELLM